MSVRRMKKLAAYTLVQFKRALKLLPGMLAVTLLMAALSAGTALVLSRTSTSDEAQQKVRIGVVGNAEADGLSQGIALLENMDNTRFSLSLEPLTQSDAARALDARELDAYIIVPDGFVTAMAQGQHLPITYVSRDNGTGVGGILVRELVQEISSLVLETERAIYGAQDYTADHMPGQDPYAAGDRLVLQYTTRILDRHRLFRLETMGAANRLSLAGYYLCGLTVLFLLLWAIIGSPFFTGRSRELSRLLRADGLSAAGQVAAEMTAFSVLLLCGVACAAGACATLVNRAGLSVPELAGQGGGVTHFCAHTLPVALMLCSMAFFLYELAGSTVSSILTLFFSAVVQGYLAGCFYPSAFFPDALRALGSSLPAGVAMSALCGRLSGTNFSLWPVWGYFLLFAVLSILLRRHRLATREEADS